MTGPALGAGRLLSTPEAVAYLASLGVRTSRRMINDLRAAGDLPSVRVRGRVRILYAPADLVAAFTVTDRGARRCRSNSLGAHRAGPGISAAPSQASAFMKALDACKNPPPMPGGCAANKK